LVLLPFLPPTAALSFQQLCYSLVFIIFSILLPLKAIDNRRCLWYEIHVVESLQKAAAMFEAGSFLKSIRDNLDSADLLQPSFFTIKHGYVLVHWWQYPDRTAAKYTGDAVTL
jgi:hypothetical protein